MEKQSWHSWSSSAPSYAEFISNKIHPVLFQVKAPHILSLLLIQNVMETAMEFFNLLLSWGT